MTYKDPEYKHKYNTDPINKEKHRAWMRDHYEHNKEYYLEAQRRNRAKKRQFLTELKSNKPCMDCGENFPWYCMDFHHRDPAEKKNVVRRAGGIAGMTAEAAKCDLICSNCHRIRTFTEEGIVEEAAIE